MDGFTYYNIFDTKSIEYLIIIGFLLLIIPYWIYLNKPLKIKKVLGILSESLLRIPQGIFYSQNQTWAYLERSGLAKIGVNDLLNHILGEVKVKSLIETEAHVKKGDFIAELEQDGRMLKISSPISGRVQAINTFLQENPETMNEDPYGKGWIFSIKPDNWVGDTKAYLLAEDASRWAKQELLRFKDFVNHAKAKHALGDSIVVMQEGGELADHPMKEMSKEIWTEFQNDFLEWQ